MIGVLAPVPYTALDPADFNDAVLIPLSGARRVMSPADPATALMRLRPGADVKATGERVSKALANAGAELQVTSARDLIREMNAQKAIHSRLLTAVGAISLLVGGIGVMNVMLMGVMERRKEIGLRAAIGATPAELRLMFLAEAVTLALAGGVAGLVLGLAAAAITARASGWTFSLALYVLPLGPGVAALVGVAFGLYPAIKASRLVPLTPCARSSRSTSTDQGHRISWNLAMAIGRDTWTFWRTREGAVVAAVAAILLLFGVGLLWRQAASQGAQSAAGEQSETVEPQPFASTISLVGAITAGDRVDVTAPFDGVVRSVGFEYGAAVSQGQVLLQLDTADLQQRQGEAVADFLRASQAEADMTNWTTGQEVSQARRAANQATLDLAIPSTSCRRPRACSIAAWWRAANMKDWSSSSEVRRWPSRRRSRALRRP